MPIYKKMDTEFIFDKKLTSGFELVITFYETSKKESPTIECQKVLSEPGYGQSTVLELQCLLFDYIEAYGIPSRSTYFYTDGAIHKIKDITIGTGTGKDGSRSIHFHIYSWG